VQQGGYDIPSPFTNANQLESYFRENLLKGLTTPGQKRGICGTDALAGGFYADGIRQLLWNTMVFSQGASPRINTRGIETSGAVPDEEQVLFSILHRFAIAKDTVKLTTPTTNMFVRSDTTRPDATSPVDLGEECNRIVVKFFNRFAGPSRENLDSYGGISHEALGKAQNSLLQYLGRKQGDPLLCGVSIQNPDPALYSPVAMNLYVRTPSRDAHETALVLIQGHWFFLDNNIGFAVPLVKPDGMEVTYADLASTTLKEILDNGRILLFLVYPDGRDLPLNTTLPPLINSNRGTLGPLVESLPRTTLFIKTAALSGAPSPAPTPAPVPIPAPAPPPAPAPAPAAGRIEAKFLKLNADDAIKPTAADAKRVLIPPPPFQGPFPIQGEGMSGVFVPWIRGDTKVVWGAGPNDALRGIVALPARRAGGVTGWVFYRFTTYILASSDFKQQEYIYPNQGGSQTIEVARNGEDWAPFSYDRGVGPFGLQNGVPDGTHTGIIHTLNPTASGPKTISPPLEVGRDWRVSNRFGLQYGRDQTLFVATPLGSLELFVEGNRWLGDYAKPEGGRRKTKRRVTRRKKSTKVLGAPAFSASYRPPFGPRQRVPHSSS
jgi:hypothetical protein